MSGTNGDMNPQFLNGNRNAVVCLIVRKINVRA